MDTITKTNTKTGTATDKRLRIILLSELDTAESLVLPETLDGRFSFQNSQGFPECQSLHFQAMNGNWYGYCSGGGVFSRNGVELGTQICLDEQSMVDVVFPSHKYAMFAEPEVSRSRGFHSYTVGSSMPNWRTRGI